MNPNPQVWRTVWDARPVSTVPRRRATPFRVRRALLTRWRVRMSWPTAGSATRGRPAPKWLSDGPTWTACQGETSLRLLLRQIHAIFFILSLKMMEMEVFEKCTSSLIGSFALLAPPNPMHQTTPAHQGHWAIGLTSLTARSVSSARRDTRVFEVPTAFHT